MATKKPRYALINGVAYSFASISLRITCKDTGKSEDITNSGFTSLNFSRTRERGKLRGPHPDPLAKTRGSNDYTASLKGYLSLFNYIQMEILGGAGYGDRFFVLDLQYSENGLDTVPVKIYACTLDSEKIDNAQGTDGTEVESDLNPLKWIKNKADDVDNPLNAA